AFAATLRARISNHLAGAVTRWASARDAEEALLVAHLAASGAAAAGRGRFAGRQPRAAANFAVLLVTVGDLRLGAEHCFLELDTKIVLQIGAALAAAALAASTAEQVAEAAHVEQIAEDVFEADKGIGVEAGEPATAAAHCRMAEAVVGSALI